MALSTSNTIDLSGDRVLVKEFVLNGNDVSALNSATAITAGAAGTAGTITVFPATTASGKTTFTASNNSGDTTTNINTAAQSGARTYTVPDAGASASFVMTAGTQTVGGAKTFSSNPVLGAGTTLDLDSNTASLTSNAATITKYACQVTTESLTTAAAAAQAFVLTLTGVAATDLAFVSQAGGTNTKQTGCWSAVCTTNTITVTVTNAGASSFDGTLIFNVWVVKP